jgi:IstB-like ATP binding protein
MIVTSNKPFSAWGAIFCDEVVAAALMDRLVDHSEIVSLQGDSYRLKDKTSAAPRRPTPPEPRAPGGPLRFARSCRPSAPGSRREAGSTRPAANTAHLPKFPSRSLDTAGKRA